jgi:hypothetical protein
MSDHSNIETCKWCGMHHPNMPCSRAKAIEYYPDGTIKRVEFWQPAAWTHGPVDVDYLLGRNK